MGGRSAKVKGSGFETEVVNAAKAKGLKARRVPLSGAVADYPGDVIIQPGYSDDPDHRIQVECKRRKHVGGLFNFLGDNDALVVRGDRQQALVVIRLNDYLELLQ